MKILITGSTGLLGQALSSHLATSCDVTGLSRHAPSHPVAIRHVVCDVLDASRTAQVIQSCQPDVVINTQAMSDVDRCEREPELARQLNVETTAHVVDALASTRTLLVHLSTDYVFDGTKGTAYSELDEPNPISVYGTSKLEGERVALRYPRAVVVRTSTLFGSGRMNFCDQIVSKLRAGQPVEAFIDQVTSPTYTEDLAVAISELSTILWRSRDTQRLHIYHMASAGGCSRVEFAQRAAELLGCSHTLIHAIPMAQQQRPAPRPSCSALTSQHVPSSIRRILRPWDDALQAYLHQRHWLN